MNGSPPSGEDQEGPSRQEGTAWAKAWNAETVLWVQEGGQCDGTEEEGPGETTGEAGGAQCAELANHTGQLGL